MLAGQFYWGGILLKSNGGARSGLSAVGNCVSSVKAQARLTVRPTSRADTKVGLSDPAVECGIAVAQRIKGTLGITG